MKVKQRTSAKVMTMLFLLGVFGGCAFVGPAVDEIDPFGQGNTVKAQGNRDASALGGGGGAGKEAEAARHALEVMGTYRRALPPEPTYPVVRPAEVRLMWIPDHLNRFGDLVPAHYYYLRVSPDMWAVTDAFELDQQLQDSGNGGGGAASTYGSSASYGSATPWVYKEEK